MVKGKRCDRPRWFTDTGHRKTIRMGGGVIETTGSRGRGKYSKQVPADFLMKTVENVAHGQIRVTQGSEATGAWDHTNTYSHTRRQREGTITPEPFRKQAGHAVPGTQL